MSRNDASGTANITGRQRTESGSGAARLRLQLRLRDLVPATAASALSDRPQWGEGEGEPGPDDGLVVRSHAAEASFFTNYLAAYRPYLEEEEDNDEEEGGGVQDRWAEEGSLHVDQFECPL